MTTSRKCGKITKLTSMLAQCHQLGETLMHHVMMINFLIRQEYNHVRQDYNQEVWQGSGRWVLNFYDFHLILEPFFSSYITCSPNCRQLLCCSWTLSVKKCGAFNDIEFKYENPNKEILFVYILLFASYFV